jgi:two-component system, NarL family, sensor histidine kinase DesK
VLGRNLALIAVNSELAAELARRGQADAVDRMLDVRRTAEESMRDVREVVAGYRATDLESELAGARSVLRSAGVSARVIGDGTALPAEVQTALAWVVREATTNIIRHSDPTVATIELDVVPGDVGSEVVLRIENDGVRVPRPRERGGNGLTGLRERLAGLGGELTVATFEPGRFSVTARLPLSDSVGGRRDSMRAAR